MTAELPPPSAQNKPDVPRLVAVFGGLGLAPFLLPLLAPVMTPALVAAADRAQVLYAAIILSFLGGARFGRAVELTGPALDIALAMAPPLLAFSALFLAFPAARVVLIASLLGQLGWDASTRLLPLPYRATRAILTAVALAGLGLGFVAFR